MAPRLCPHCDVDTQTTPRECVWFASAVHSFGHSSRIRDGMPRARGAHAAYLRCNGVMTTTATSAPTVTVGTGPLTFDDGVAVARHDARVEISPESLAEVRRTRAVIEALAD